MNLKTRLDSHFVAVAAAAGAAALGGTAQNSEAAIVWSGAVNINIPTTTSGVYLNVVTGANNTSPSLVPGWDVNPWGSGDLFFFNPSAPAGGVYVVSGAAPTNLAAGTPIDGASTYGSGAGDATFALNSSNNLVGFRFQNEAAANQTQYGWMRILLSGSTIAQPRAIVEYAYEDSGAGIPAGAVPAPGSVALLALGALGLTGRRRK